MGKIGLNILLTCILRICINNIYMNIFIRAGVKLWTPSALPIHNYIIPHPCESFSKKYDAIQEQIQAISGVDELLSGINVHYTQTHIQICIFTQIFNFIVQKGVHRNAINNSNHLKIFSPNPYFCTCFARNA